MATTTYFDFTAAARAINARTDSGGTPTADDMTAEEDRLSHEFVTQGWVIEALAYAPSEGAVGTMIVYIGSDGSRTDYYIVGGDATGQGNYVARLAARTNVPLDAADPSLGRKDEIYLVIEDHAYDANSRSLGRLAHRTGTPAITPLAPGADSGWNAYVLLATIDIPAGAPDIGSCTITDERTESQLVVDAATLDGLDAADFATAGHAHAADYTPIAHDGATTGHPEATGSVAGFMDSTDKTELDGIEASADVNPTAAEILTSIKTVDGAGSGLDADLLDGVHASGLATSGHNHNTDHYTEAQSDASLDAKRNRPEAVFTYVNSGVTFAPSSLEIAQTNVESLDDWGGHPGAAGIGTVEGGVAGGMYLVYGQVEYETQATDGYRMAHLYDTGLAGDIAKVRVKAIVGSNTIVNIQAVWRPAGASDDIQLRVYHTASEWLSLGTQTWLRVIALEH